MFSPKTWANAHLYHRIDLLKIWRFYLSRSEGIYESIWESKSHAQNFPGQQLQFSQSPNPMVRNIQDNNCTSLRTTERNSGLIKFSFYWTYVWGASTHRYRGRYSHQENWCWITSHEFIYGAAPTKYIQEWQFSSIFLVNVISSCSKSERHHYTWLSFIVSNACTYIGSWQWIHSSDVIQQSYL